ncbi:Phosphoglycerate dehydrogenase or related dehydrogenase [Gulbenkiania indica]|uniref:D-3-phosphoglycerate dehydrogenase n=2 Tax=Gulbenkiania TaxID=397456 RepID=A0A0K6GVP4_9NEIS|nr:phosphoglycerate dehydrogenase [Gulbenkiania indica]TCW29061.1 D-3-phosphoglycerate dehydrogenase [Gulbenkiania mobilis]CUA82563.1 Phosphoglycerate dehydrogenase or related dehydrogenase [Gulbenkiania indica]
MQNVSLAKDRIKVLLLEGVHQSAVDAFQADGYTNIEFHKKALPPAELIERIADAHIIGIRSRTQLTEEAFSAAKRLMAVGCFCIGTNQVDLKAAAVRGIPVFNAPFSNTRSVAELVIAETIMLMRGVPEKNALAHQGGWLKSAEGSYEVRGKTLGIVGYGHIGTQVGVLAESMGMRVIFYDIENKLTLGNTRQVASLDALLSEADVVTLHVPETPETRDMIDAPQLARMKPGSHLINASRGTVVVIEALAEALAQKHLAGAAIDVFPVEPEGNGEAFVSPLQAFPNVILTPHVGGSTLEAQANIGGEVASKLIKYSNNGSTLTAVNFPEVSLPEQRGKCRLLHIHANKPGILAQINEQFSRAGINIVAQYLQTNDTIGYVVIETDTAASQAALETLQRIDGTIRCRLLF